MNFSPTDDQRALEEAGAALGGTCVGLSPAQAGEDWRRADAKGRLRAIGPVGAAIFLDAYAAARGSLRAARFHGADTIATAPDVFEAVLLGGGVEGLIREVVENLRLPLDVRPERFPVERDPDVRHALADARAWSSLARHLSLRAAWLVEVGTPTAEVRTAPPMALCAAGDAVLKVWPALSRLLIGEESYQRFETELFRPAARLRPGAVTEVATGLLGPRPSVERKG